MHGSSWTLPEAHMQPRRGWTLIRDGGILTQQETAHLESCQACNDWLVGFVSLARNAGFHVFVEVPPCKIPERLQAT
jgi:hypothetical protein